MKNARTIITSSAVALALVGVVGACSSTPSSDVECIDVPDIGATLSESIGETVTDAVAVENPESGNYYVAAAWDGADGVWLTDSIDPVGSMLSVDNVAKVVTDFPDAEQVAGITYPNDFTKAAKGCLP